MFHRFFNIPLCISSKVAPISLAINSASGPGFPSNLICEGLRNFPKILSAVEELAPKLVKEIAPEAKEVNNTITELVKETQGVKPDEEPKLLKQQKWRERFFKVLENILHILPKTAETIAIFTPLAPFSKLIGNTIEKVVEEVQKEL